jgi:uncharacterized lipoprotein YddW (UPF0748 family)
MHFSTPQDWDEIMGRLSRHGLNAIFVRIGRGGTVVYPSQWLPREEWAEKAGGDELARAIAAAHRHGIQFHAWKVCFHLGNPSRYGPAAEQFSARVAREDRLARDSKNRPTHWLNPADPRNRELEIHVVREIVQRYAVDGIHLDYIRYPDEPSMDFDYGPVSRRQFERSLGKPVANWPADVISGPLKLRYEDWERDQVTQLVASLRDAVHATPGGGALFSAAVWRNIHRNRATIKQDWPRWAREGLVDFLVPMDYEKDLDEFRRAVALDLAHAQGYVPVIAGIGSWQLKPPEAVVDQVQAARSAGADGFSLFSFNADAIDRHLAALAAGPTRTPALAAVGGPRFEVAVRGDAVLPRYRPWSIAPGRPVEFVVRPRDWPMTTQALDLSVAVEDLAGQRWAGPQRATLKPGSAVHIRLPEATRPLRAVLRGTLLQGNRPRRFVARGPIVEPVDSAHWTQLAAQSQPPTFAKRGCRVGVYAYGLGSDAILDALAQDRRLAVAAVHRLLPDHLSTLDVLILPHLWDTADSNDTTRRVLRAWVESGGRLILTRDAVGFRWHARMFPEIGVGMSLSSSRDLQAVIAVPEFPRSTPFQHEYGDHVQLAAGPKGQVLVTERPSGKPVALSGTVGKGTVILCGLVPGYDKEQAADSSSMRYLRALVAQF